jgi:thiol-disulfide isomerase/thioredoxin
MSSTHRTLAPLALSLVLAACAATESPQPAASEAASAPMSAPASAAEPSTTAAASADEPSPSASAAADALLATTLTDVRSGETFTLGELAADGPILLEPMAVWCTNCRAQQHEVKRAHEAGDFQSVSLDVDLSETADALAEYADREGFDWRFAMADASLYRLLQERFGVAATNPPSTPLIVIEPDGTVRPLEFGRGTRSADQLLTEIGAG